MKKIPVVCCISKMGVADSSGQNLDWEAIRISFQFKIDTCICRTLKQKSNNAYLLSEFFPTIPIPNVWINCFAKRAYVCGYFFPSFSDLFYAAFRLQPAPIWSALGFLHFQAKLNYLINISSREYQTRNLKNLVKWKAWKVLN